jgi:hypothetical protein
VAAVPQIAPDEFGAAAVEAHRPGRDVPAVEQQGIDVLQRQLQDCCSRNGPGEGHTRRGAPRLQEDIAQPDGRERHIKGVSTQGCSPEDHAGHRLDEFLRLLETGEFDTFVWHGVAPGYSVEFPN